MFTPQLLAAGQLTNAKATLYTVPTGMRAKIEGIHYFNTTAGALTAKTFINNGTSREVDEHSIGANSRYIALDKTAPYYLDATHLIEGNTSANTSINYHIFGQLEQKG